MNGATNETIQNQIDQLFSSILLEQQSINKVKGPDKDKESLLTKSIEDYVATRGKALFYKYFSSGRGHGPFTELIDGSVKYDLINGIGFNILGHSHPIFIKSCLEAATVDTMMVGNLQSYSEPAELTKTLTDAVKGSSLKYFWFAGSGSFANDVALKILWQKKAPNYKLIAFDRAFAGRSVATQEITANPAYREDMPKLVDVYHVPHWDEKDPENSTAKTIAALDKLIEDHGNTFCAITLELIQGEGGFIAGTKEYYETIFKWAKEKGIYIWVDEVQTFSRTHELFSFQMFGLDKYVDIVTLAKAVQGAGVLYSDELNPKPGLIAGTFNGSIPAIKAGAKIVKYLTEGNFYGKDGRIAEIERKFREYTKKLSAGSCKGKIGNIGGVGTMFAYEVGDTSKEITLEYIKKLFDNGIVSFLAGKNPTRVRFLLPVCLTDEHIEDIFKIIEKTTLEVIK